MSLFVEDNLWIFLIMTVFFGGGAAFLAADHKLEFVLDIMHGIEHGQIRFARHAERHLGTVQNQ